MQLVASLFFFSRKIILSRNSRKRRGCAGVPFGIYIAHKFHKFHECLSLRDGFFSHRLHRFYRFFILTIRFALLLRKNRSADLHRFFIAARWFFAHKFHKFHECLSLCDRFFSHRLHRFYRFFILVIRFALLLCKNRSVDLHRFYRCAMFFLPTNFTNITNIYCYVIVFFCRFY